MPVVLVAGVVDPPTDGPAAAAAPNANPEAGMVAEGFVAPCPKDVDPKEEVPDMEGKAIPSGTAPNETG
jgi:hypothetical protein